MYACGGILDTQPDDGGTGHNDVNKCFSVRLRVFSCCWVQLHFISRGVVTVLWLHFLSSGVLSIHMHKPQFLFMGSLPLTVLCYCSFCSQLFSGRYVKLPFFLYVFWLLCAAAVPVSEFSWPLTILCICCSACVLSFYSLQITSPMFYHCSVQWQFLYNFLFHFFPLFFFFSFFFVLLATFPLLFLFLSSFFFLFVQLLFLFFSPFFFSLSFFFFFFFCRCAYWSSGLFISHYSVELQVLAAGVFSHFSVLCVGVLLLFYTAGDLQHWCSLPFFCSCSLPFFCSCSLPFFCSCSLPFFCSCRSSLQVFFHSSV